MYTMEFEEKRAGDGADGCGKERGALLGDRMRGEGRDERRGGVGVGL